MTKRPSWKNCDKSDGDQWRVLWRYWQKDLVDFEVFLCMKAFGSMFAMKQEGWRVYRMVEVRNCRVRMSMRNGKD